MNIKQKLVAHATAALMLASILSPMAVVHAVTAPTTPALPTAAGVGNAGSYLNDVGTASGQAKVSAPEIIGRVIYIVLGLLGLIFLVLALYAGFGWMTAQGDPKKVDAAQATLKDAVVGMVVVVSAYALSNFIIGQLGAIAQ
ncbi:MAG: hypothetical protein NT003_04730 [Candidatus Magasanikbacteria bacterium]|nr:hypothetical protein [Candidatus Magasanikbacteria bacterium]